MKITGLSKFDYHPFRDFAWPSDLHHEHVAEPEHDLSVLSKTGAVRGAGKGGDPMMPARPSTGSELILCQAAVPSSNLHLKAIYEEGELAQGGTIKAHLIVPHEGARQVSRPVRHYNLPALSRTAEVAT